MRQRPLGGSGLLVSEVALGGNNFGGRLDERASVAVIHAALDAGVTLIDTADVYNAGRSEEIVGRAVRRRRDDVLIATKCGMPSEEGEHAGGLGPAHVRRSVERSLRRLGTDRIDLLQLHIGDDATAIDDTLGALGELVTAGTVRACGCSNFWTWELAEAVTLARVTGLPSMASVSVEWSVLDREPERELVGAARHFQVGILPYRPLAQGFLSGKYRRGTAPPPGTRLDLVPSQATLRLEDANFDVLDRLEAIATDHHVDVSGLALGYLLAWPEVSAVVLGASDADQAVANARAAERWPELAVALAEVRDALPPLPGTRLGAPHLRQLSRRAP